MIFLLSQSLSSRSSSCTIVEGIVYPFSWESPEYAFPTPYPPEFTIDPFPRLPNAFTHSKLEWRRAHATPARYRKPDLDITALSTSFGRLSLNDTEPVNEPKASTIRSCGVPTSQCTQANTIGGCNPFGVRIYPAPLPSLVVRQRVQEHDSKRYPWDANCSRGLSILSTSFKRPTSAKCSRFGLNLTVARRFGEDSFNTNTALGSSSSYQDMQRRKRSILSLCRNPLTHTSHLCGRSVNNEPKSASYVSL